MFHLFGGGCFVWSAALLALSLVASDAGADPFDEFRIPAHRVLTWDASLGSSGSRTTDNTSFQQGTRMLGGNLGSSLYWLSDSDPRRTSVSADVRVSGDRTRRTRVDDYPGYLRADEVDHLRDAGEQVGARFSHARYSGAMPVALTVELGGRAAWDQDWDNSRWNSVWNPQLGFPYDRRVEENDSRRWRFTHDVDATIGAGLGRVRDATPVYDVIVLEQRLRRSGALQAPLQPDTRQRLADVLAMASDYSRTRDRPAKALWREIARILAQDPASVTEGPAPDAVQRAAEPFFGAESSHALLPASPILRNVGTRLQVVLAGRQGDSIDRWDWNDHVRYYLGDSLVGAAHLHQARHDRSNVSDAFAGLAGEYHRPIGVAWQVDASARTLMSLRSKNNSLELDAHAGTDWIIADRWLGSVDLRHVWTDADRTRGPSASDQAIWLYGASIGYYLEDHLVLQLTASEQQIWIRGGANRVSHRFVRDGALSLALSYRIAGRFFAPDHFMAAGAGGS